MKSRHIIAYICYGVVATAVFLYLLFPVDSVANYLKAQFAEENSDLNISFGTVQRRFFPGIMISDFTLAFRGQGGAALHADSVKIEPNYKNVLFGKLGLDFLVHTYDGNIHGDISFDEYFSVAGPCTSLLEMQSIDLAECELLKALLGRVMEGKIDGTLKYSGEYGRTLIAGDADGVFNLHGVSFELLNSVLGFEKLSFDSIIVHILLQNQVLKINKLDLSGKQIRGSFTGKIFLNKDLKLSRLDMRGMFEIPALGKKLAASLNGTIAAPVPKFR